MTAILERVCRNCGKPIGDLYGQMRPVPCVDAAGVLHPRHDTSTPRERDARLAEGIQGMLTRHDKATPA